MNIIWQKAGGWRLLQKEVTLPDGRLSLQVAVEHPGSVVLIPVRGDELLLINQYRGPLEAMILELAAGTRGWGEDWEACARREIQEETGFAGESFTHLGDIYPAVGSSNELMRLFLVRGLTPSVLPQDEDEYIEPRWMPIQEAVAMAVDGRLQDAKSIVGILRAHHFLQNEK